MDGQMRQLKQVYLATPAVMKEPLVRNAVPMLAVNDAKDEKWLEFHPLRAQYVPERAPLPHSAGECKISRSGECHHH